jgi:hypothetical protein
MNLKNRLNMNSTIVMIKPAARRKNNILETRQLAEATPLSPNIPATTASIKNIMASISRIIRTIISYNIISKTITILKHISKKINFLI